MPVGDSAQLVELARVAEHVDRDDRLRALGDRGLDGTRIHVQRAGIDVCENGRPALENEAVRGGDERDRRRDHLVAGLNAGNSAQEVEPGRATRQGNRIRSADPLGDHLLEAIDHRAEREPPRPQHFQHELFFALAEIRPRQRDRRSRLLRCHACAGVRVW